MMMMVATRTPCFSASLDDVPPPPVDISPLLVARKRRGNSGKNQQQQQRRRRVSFHPEVSVQHTLHHKDYTASEKRESWLTMDELKSMKRSCQRLALALSNPITHGDDDDNNNDDDDGEDASRCLRGLEGRTRQGISKRKRVRNAAREAVLWEQNLRRRWGISVDGFHDEDATDEANAVADAYYEFTECAQIEAHMVGLRDASVAREFLAPATTTTTTTSTTTTITTTADSKKLPSSSTSSSRDPPAGNNNNNNNRILLPSGGRSRNNLPSSLSRVTSTRRLLTDAFFQV